MMIFANKVTLFICSFISLISFCITSFSAFSEIGDFHGGWVDFFLYLGSGLLDSSFNAAMVFCFSGIIVLPILLFVEKKMFEVHLKTLREKLLSEDKSNKTKNESTK